MGIKDRNNFNDKNIKWLDEFYNQQLCLIITQKRGDI